MVVTQAAEKVITQLRERAAKIWKIDPDAITWDNGEASLPATMPASSIRCRWPSSPPGRPRPAGRSAPAPRPTPPAPRAASARISAMSRSTATPAASG
ncbi:MAG TPA: hypothetical protein VK777_06405 [Reyranella sp.]|nr:hypothetical protein [Reyranella sp.]